MPRVPTYDNLQTQVSGQPNVQFQSPGGPTPGAIAAEQASKFGQAAMGAGDAAGKIAMDMAQQVNETRVMDAVNKAKERMYDLTYNKDTGYSMQKGINALERPDGADLATEYSQKFQKDLDGLSAGLGNDFQKQAFAKAAGQMRTEMYGSAERHMSQEFTRYQGSVYDGASSNAQRQIALNYNDVAKGGAVEQGVAAIEAATRSKARLSGLSQEFADTEVRKAVSNAHSLAIATALEKNDVSFASGYLKKFAGQMDADDILKMQGHVTKEMDLRQAEGIAAKAVAQVAPKMFDSDGDRVVAITMNTESNGRRYGPDGKTLLASPKDAKGEMQVLDSTNKNPGYGVKPAQDDGPDERARVGRDYIKAMIQRYDGDLAKAWAAYNAGPGRLDQEIKDAAKRGVPDAWLSNMPAETRDYVKKNVAAYQAGDGRAAMPTLLDVHAQVRQQLGPDARPQVVQAALQRSTQQFEDLVKAKTAQDTENVANAMRGLVQNGGKYSELPASVRAALPPKEIDNVMNFGSRISKGDDTTNSALYLKLTQPGALARISDNDFFLLRGQLNEADFKHFSKERSTQMTGGGANGPGELNTQAINDTMRDRLRSLKMDPTPKDGSSDAEQLGIIHRFVRNELAEAQRNAGKKFTDVETAKFIDGLFAKNVTFKGLVYGTNSQSVMSLKPGDVPSDVRKTLEADFKLAGVTSPTDADILGAYLRLKTRKPKAVGVTGSY